MNDPSVVISSNAPMIWSALCVTCRTQGLAPVRIPRDGELAAAVGVAGPTVLVVDLTDLPVNERSDEVSALCGRFPKAERPPGVLLLSDDPERSGTVELLKCGVRGVFTPDMPLDLFPKAVRRIADGELWWTRPQISGVLESLLTDEDMASTGEVKSAVTLTPREEAVVGLMAQGKNHMEIAGILGFTSHTARTHIRNVMRKLNAHSRTEAVQVALRAGLLDEG